MFDEIEIYKNIKFNHNLKESDTDNIDVRSQVEQKFPNQ